MATLKLLSKIDERTKDAVRGWFREHEKMLKLRNVPMMISAICILYFRKDEIFDSFNDKYLELSKNKKCVSRNNYHNTNQRRVFFADCYGINEIQSTNKGKYEWNLRMYGDEYFRIYVGISSYRATAINLYEMNDGYGYAFTAFGFKISKEGKNKLKRSDRQAFRFQGGDKISLCLNLYTRQLNIKINDDVYRQSVFDDIKQGKDIKYKLIVSLAHDNQKVQIEDFKGI